MFGLGDDDESDTRTADWWMTWLRVRVLRMTDWMLRGVGIRRDVSKNLKLSDVLRGVRVRDLMTHRTDMRCVDESDRVSDVIEKCLGSTVTNWLVIERNDRDRVVGRLDVGRLMRDAFDGIEDMRVMDYVTDVVRMLDANTVDDVMRVLVEEDEKLIVLMDEYGGTAGVVTKSDVMRVLYKRLT